MDLVITSALAEELPVGLIESSGHKIIDFARLKNSDYQTDKGILFVITGIGPEKSRRAAKLIVEKLRPAYVLNIGTSGALLDEEPGSWFTPRFVIDDDGREFKVMSSLPIPIDRHVNRKITDRLISLAKPVIGNRSEFSDLAEHVDMEAFFQAQVFAEHDIPFHVLKRVSDSAGANAVSQWKKEVKKTRDELGEIFSFLANQNKTISVVIPVYNRAERIKACVESVLAQSLPPEEIIVVDDGSTDKTAVRLKEFGDKIKVISLGKNEGVSFARNVGTKMASSEYIAYLDSDDLWQPEKIENAKKFIGKNRHYQIFQSEEIWIRNGKRVNPKQRHKNKKGWIFEPSLSLCLISPSCVVMKKSLWSAYDRFDESLPACEDYDLWLKITRHHPVGFDGYEGTIKYGGHADQLSRKFEAIDRFRIKALAGAASREKSAEQKKRIESVLIQKLEILKAGAQKRGLCREADEYDNFLAGILADGN